MRKSQLLILKSIVAFSFLLGLLLWVNTHLDWKEILSAWSKVEAIHLAGATTLVAFSHWIRALRVHLAYRRAHKLDFISVTAVSFVHNTVSFLLPMRLGEAALPLLSKTRLQVPLAYSTASLLLLRIFDAHWLLLLLAIFASASLLNESAMLFILILLASVPVVVWLMAIAANKHQRFKSIRPLVSDALAPIMLYLITGLIWGTKLAALAYLASTLGDLRLDHAWVATIIADASALSPITGFANAGTFEAAFALPLMPLGHDGTTLVKTALNLHLFILITNVAIGAIGMLLLLFSKHQSR